MIFIRRSLWWQTALFFFTAAVAHAHDVLQSSTNIWFQPDQMEVELIMARMPSRILLDNPPPVPLTEANFESTYRALYQKCAPGLIEITLDGKKMAPGSISVELYQDTDIRFDYLFPRPTHSLLHFTASFIKRMNDGYINTLSANEGNSVLGFGSQDADKLFWELNLGTDQGNPATTVANSGSGPVKIFVVNHAEGVVIDKNFSFYTGLFCVILGLIALGVFIKLRRKRRVQPPP